MDDNGYDLWLAYADQTTDNINAINANYTQIKEAEKNRQLQQSMLNQNLAFQEDMYWTQFNNLSPKKQRELLEEAGYNPAALVASGYTPQQAAAQGGGGIGSGAMPQTFYPQSRLSQNLSTISQQQLNNSMAKKAEAEAMEKEITNKTKGLEQMEIIRNLVKKGFLTEQEANAYIIDNKIKQDAYEDIVNGYAENTRKTQGEADQVFIQNELTKQFGWKKEIANIAMLIAQGNEAKAREEAIKAGIKTSEYEAVTNRINAITNQRNAAVNERNAKTAETATENLGNLQGAQKTNIEAQTLSTKLGYISQLYDGIKAQYDTEVARVKANDANAMDAEELRKMRVAVDLVGKIKNLFNPLSDIIHFPVP